MRVSTVIPTYNRSADVVHAVDSALAQRYPTALHEILVVDDGSTDDTAAVLARYGDRIRYLPVANGGVAAARNHGIAHARGEAIAFLDSDDTWEPDKLAAQVAVLARGPAIGMVLTSMTVVDAERRPSGTFSRRTTIPEDGFVLPYVLRNPAMTPSTALVRAAVLREVGGFDASLRTAEDLDLHLRIALHHQEAVVDQPLVHYMRSAASLGASPRTYRDYMRVMTRFVTRHADELDPRDRAAALRAAYLRNARGLAYGGAVGPALAFGVRGARYAASAEDAREVGALLLQIARSAAGRAFARR